MKKERRQKHSREFKFEAVRLSNSTDKTVAEVARELDVRENDLHNWRQTVREHGDNAFPGYGKKQKGNTEQGELDNLRQENKRLREERDILKKSAIFFANELKTDTNS